MYNIQQIFYFICSGILLLLMGSGVYLTQSDGLILNIYFVVYYNIIVSIFCLDNQYSSKIQQSNSKIYIGMFFLPMALPILFIPNIYWKSAWGLILLSSFVGIWFSSANTSKRMLFFQFVIGMVYCNFLDVHYDISPLIFTIVSILLLMWVFLSIKKDPLIGNMLGWLWFLIHVCVLISLVAKIDLWVEFVRVWSGVVLVACLLHMLSPQHRIVLECLFSHWKPTTSIDIFAQNYLGLDFRGLWTTQVLQQRTFSLISIVPFLLWLSSSLYVVPSDSVGIREYFGRLESTTLQRTGLHTSLPFPFGTIHIIPTKHVFSLSIGHQENMDTENMNTENMISESILWADQHADEEFTLLLGDGKDLISTDGIVVFQIFDAHAYLQKQKEAEDILEMLVYRALMMETSSRQLDQSVSENIQDLSKSVFERVVNEVQKFDLGIIPLDITLVALHPPVSVAEDYQDVISAQIISTSIVLHANAAREQLLPKSQAEQNTAKQKALGDAKKIIAQAQGEAIAFTRLQESVDVLGSLYIFEAQHKAIRESLKGRRCTIIDHRIERDGAALWIDNQ